MDFHGMKVAERSIRNYLSGRVFMARDGNEDLIIADHVPGFRGRDLEEGVIAASLNHENACVLRKLFPFTAPGRVLGKERSFGLGDRLGIATAGHIKVFEKYDAFPVFAQQSIRELNLTGRTYEEVLDAASFAVFKAGFTKTWGADGDHLKTPEDIEHALSLGYSMITLDCSDYIKPFTENAAPPLNAAYKEKYLEKKFDIDSEHGITIDFSEDDLKSITGVYGEAINFAVEMYNRFLKDGKYKADFEISIDEALLIDETSNPTSPREHYFIARELRDAKVDFKTLAPRFCGEFQKGIDYIGDLNRFKKEIKIHAAIARHFNYKLSIHSGSDKFSVFPAIAQETRCSFHTKTAGTSWLVAMKLVAQKDPSLYREIHRFALSVFDEAKKYYHVTSDLSKIPGLDSLEDAALPALFDNDTARQLIHITYGLILGSKNSGGVFTYRERLYKLWSEYAEDYAEALEEHIGRHLDLLGVTKERGKK
ncbi:MAG: tagaturonate epimerase family protein [Treponema sp.]|nr:tagaturonate epimerase family protein [Treponema sp.]